MSGHDRRRKHGIRAVSKRGSLADVPDADLVGAYEELGTTAAVGKRYGVGHLAVWRRLAKLGVVTPRDKIVHVSDADMMALYRELGSLQAAASRLGVTRERVRQRLQAAGAEMAPRGGRPVAWSAEDVERLRATYAEAGSYSRTAEATGVPKSTIYTLIGPKSRRTEGG